MNLGKIAIRFSLILIITLSFILPACTLIVPENIGTVDTPFPHPAETEDAAIREPTPSGPYSDAAEVMSDICFESANDAAGRTFVLRSEDELAAFYGLADNSQLCRHPVARKSFDFSNGRVLAGLWSAGRGCTARHDELAFQRDDEAKHIIIRLKLVIEGNCNYELVRPFWIGIRNAQDYQITIEVE